jgi:hypothetical protein
MQLSFQLETPGSLDRPLSGDVELGVYLVDVHHGRGGSCAEV